jgi:RNA polymerase sigma-70 factor (ECF subfamily)
MGASHSDLFGLFYRENYPGIYRYTYRFVRNSEEAEQLTQESFKKLYAVFVNGTEAADIKALAYRITHNTCLNFLKKEEKLKSVLKQRVPTTLPSAPSAEDVVIAKQRLELLHQGIMSLSKRDQQCLFLYWEGFSYKEISAIAHIRRTSVGKILARAINSLSHVCIGGGMQ